MGSVAIVQPKVKLANLLQLVGLPSKAAVNERTTTEIVGRANQLVRTVVSLVDDLVSSAIEKRSAEGFTDARAQIFPQYFEAMRALGDLARIFIQKQTIDSLSAEWFSELESDFSELGPSSFGWDLTERGIFTVWTLRKIHDLGQEIAASSSPKQNEDKESELAMDFAAKAMWTRFHVDCLTTSMRSKKPIYPEVLDPLRDGLRAAVNTYACIRQWADLRHPRPEPDLGPIEWTNDDELLLADSMRDLEKESA